MKNAMKKTVTVTAALVGFSLAASTQGAVLFSEDFEGAGGPSGTGWIFFAPPSQSFTGNYTPSGSFTGNSSLLWHNGAGPYVPYSGADVEGIGSTYGTIGSTLGTPITISGDTGVAFEDGERYVFSFTQFRRPDSTGGGLAFDAEIFDVSTTLALQTVSFPAIDTQYLFADRSIIYTAGAGEDGNNIGLRFVATGVSNIHVTGIDNISFGTVVPEPSTLALLGIGMAGLMGARRRRSTGAV